MLRGIEISCVTVHSSSFGKISRSQSSIFGIVTRPQVGQSRVQIPVWARDLSFLQNVQTGPGTHPAKYSVGTGVISLGYSSLSVKLNLHLNLVLMLRMSGTIPLLPPYTSLVWIWKTLPLWPNSSCQGECYKLMFFMTIVETSVLKICKFWKSYMLILHKCPFLKLQAVGKQPVDWGQIQLQAS